MAKLCAKSLGHGMSMSMCMNTYIMEKHYPKKKWRKKILEACITNQRLQKIKEKKEVDTYLYLQKI